MGNIAKRPNGKWRARYRDPGGREHARHFERRIDAQKWLAEVEVARHRGDWLDPARSSVRFGEWSAEWLSDQVHLKPSTSAHYELALKRHVWPRWGNYPLDAIEHGDVQRWITDLQRSGLGPSTVRYAHRVFSRALDAAVHDRRITRNPATHISLPGRKTERPHRYLTHEELEQLAMAAEPYEDIVRLLGYTGLRWGEMAALTVGNIDFHRRRLNIVAAITEVKGRVILGTPKTHQRRQVPFPEFLTPALLARARGKAQTDLVFPNRDGGYLRNTNFRPRVFARAARDAGLDGITPHTLRHTAASLAVSSGATVKSVQKMLGHASAAMTLDVYAGLFDDELDMVADDLGRARDAALSQLRAPGSLARTSSA